MAEDCPTTTYAKIPADARKRAWERVILGMVYDLSNLDHWEHRDRPDFAIWKSGSDKPVGVEVTQTFPSESHARLALIDGYLESLWQGAPHRHRDDVATLHAAGASIHGPDGSLKSEDVPIVMTDSPTEDGRRSALHETVKSKIAREYDPEDFRHINLAILDWFGLGFDASEYSTSQFFDTDFKEMLRLCPFNEIFYVLADTKSDSGGSRDGELRYVYLHLVELFLTSEYFLTGSAIAETDFASEVEGPEHLARLIGAHLTRERGTGRPVFLGGGACVQLGGSVVGLTREGGLNVLQFADAEVAHLDVVNIDERLPNSIAEEVDAFVDSHNFVWGYADDVVEMPVEGEPVAKTMIVSEVPADAQRGEGDSGS